MPLSVSMGLHSCGLRPQRSSATRGVLGVCMQIIVEKFYRLADGTTPDTKHIFQPVRILCAYHRDNTLRDILVKNSLQTT